MATRVTHQPHYLPADACGLIGEVFQSHPLIASLAVLVSLGAAIAILRRRFGRADGEIFAIALFFVILTIFSVVCLYLLATRPGYRIFHSAF